MPTKQKKNSSLPGAVTTRKMTLILAGVLALTLVIFLTYALIDRNNQTTKIKTEVTGAIGDPCFQVFGVAVGDCGGGDLNDNANADLSCIPISECAYTIDPKANFNPSQTAPNFVVQFLSNAVATNGKCSAAPQYFWDFDDGTRSNRSSPLKTYTAGGTYKPNLKVSWDGNCQTQALPRITVAPGDFGIPINGFKDIYKSSNSIEVGWNFSNDATITSYTVKWGLPKSNTGNIETDCSYPEEGWPNKSIDIDRERHSFVFNKDGNRLLAPNTEYCAIVSAKRGASEPTKTPKQKLKTTAPMTLRAAYNDDTSIKFTWSDPGVNTVPSTFNHFKLCYGNTQSDADNCTESTMPNDLKDKNVREFTLRGLTIGRRITAILKVIDNTGNPQPDSILALSNYVTPQPEVRYIVRAVAVGRGCSVKPVSQTVVQNATALVDVTIQSNFQLRSVTDNGILQTNLRSNLSMINADTLTYVLTNVNANHDLSFLCEAQPANVNGNNNNNSNINNNINRNNNLNNNSGSGNNPSGQCSNNNLGSRGDINCDTRVDSTDLAIIRAFVVRNIFQNLDVNAILNGIRLKNGDVTQCSDAQRDARNIDGTDVAYYREFITNNRWPGVACQ